MVKNKEKTVDKPKCSKCGSGFGYVRTNSNERQCRNCGHIDKIEVNK